MPEDTVKWGVFIESHIIPYMDSGWVTAFSILLLGALIADSLLRFQKWHENRGNGQDLAVSGSWSQGLGQDSVGVNDSRIPLTDFRSLATNAGWNLSGEDELVLEFCLAISQAALDGEIKFFGRKEEHISEAANRRQKLRPIPIEHWEEFNVEPIRFMSCDDNFSIMTYILGSPAKGYRDLHVDKEQAIQWLNTTAEKHKKVDPKKWQ
ncbi:MAG: hypothetical protein K9M17_03760 [Mariprofundaceae bacterium]|nr:hypothetical protein [Mariprofundaceae bacterium]